MSGAVNAKVAKAKSVKAEKKASEAAVKNDAAEPAVELVKPEVLAKPVNGEPDDLKKISGIGPVLEAKLNSLGIYYFHQIASWGASEVAWIDDYLSFKGRVIREKWISQAETFKGEGV